MEPTLGPLAAVVTSLIESIVEMSKGGKVGKYTVRSLIDKLNSFTTEDQIAQFLREKNITGLVGENDSCPIANLFQQELGLSSEVDNEKIVIHSDFIKDGQTESETFDIEGTVLSAFIDDFDAERYPDLVDSEDDDEDFDDDDDDEDEDFDDDIDDDFDDEDEDDDFDEEGEEL